ncbi:MAG: Fe-S-containing hydro-lyase [Planctomycetota bacterium]|jgi:fumarate hydratase subunit beta
MPPTEIPLPLTPDTAKGLKAGDVLHLNGVLYTARDAAHLRICQALARGESPPFPLKGAVIYYVGPTPGTPEQVVGAAGPTTSYRMDAYAPLLLDQGVLGMIGKGQRSTEVVEAMKRNGAVYLAATGGAGALLARAIHSAEVVAYEDLGTEAVRRLEVRDFPVVVAIDATGKSLYR